MPLPVTLIPLATRAALPVATRAAGALGGAIAGKRKRSSCRAVSSGDMEGFRDGSVAPWVVWDRVDDIAVALGLHSGFGYAQDSVRQMVLRGGDGRQAITYRDVADLHVSVFVPLCEGLEGGESGYTDDPNAGQGLATYNSARAAFREKVRSGSLLYRHAPRGGMGGDMPSAGGGGLGGPAQAGFSLGGNLGLIALAAAGAFILTRGR